MFFYDLLNNAYGPYLEDWRPIVGYEKFYMVSNYGRVKALKKQTLVVPKNGYKPYIQYYPEFIMSTHFNKNGYCSIMVTVDKKHQRLNIHRAQAKVFFSNCKDELQVNHKNGIKSDNFILNLEMLTVSENILHSYRNLPMKSLKGKSNYKTNVPVTLKMTDGKIIDFISMEQAGIFRELHPTNISAFVRKIRSDVKGYEWNYKNKK